MRVEVFFASLLLIMVYQEPVLTNFFRWVGRTKLVN